MGVSTKIKDRICFSLLLRYLLANVEYSSGYMEWTFKLLVLGYVGTVEGMNSSTKPRMRYRKQGRKNELNIHWALQENLRQSARNTYPCMLNFQTKLRWRKILVKSEEQQNIGSSSLPFLWNIRALQTYSRAHCMAYV